MLKSNKENNKVVCKDCGIEKNLEKSFYLSRIPTETGRMEVCKECFKEEFRNEKDVFDVFKKYDIPFIKDLWDISEKDDRSDVLTNYIRNINSLSQYKGLRWKDSILEKTDEEYTEIKAEIFEASTIKNLEFEAEQLQKKIKQTREAENMGTYKNLAQNLEIILKMLDERKGRNPVSYNVVVNVPELKTGNVEEFIRQMKMISQFKTL